MPDLSKDVSAALRSNGKTLVLAESCTGGRVASAITALPGSSQVFERGYVTYSNEAKIECLSVPSEIIEEYGAVSAECAAFMAKGALQNSHADIAISITGIAGPDGGNEEKPIGLVFFGLSDGQGVTTHEGNFHGSREEIQSKAVDFALETLLKNLKK